MPDLPPDHARKLLRVELMNIQKKLKSGKTLSMSERAMLESAAAPSTAGIANDTTRCKSYVELAKVLGVTRQTLHEWNLLEGSPKPESNGDHVVSSWRVYMYDNGLGSKSKGGDDDAPASHSDTELRARKLLAEVETKEHKLSILRGDSIPSAKIEAFFGLKAGEAGTLLSNKLTNELPPILAAMDNAGEIKRTLEAVYDEFIRILKRGEINS